MCATNWKVPHLFIKKKCVLVVRRSFHADMNTYYYYDVFHDNMKSGFSLGKGFK